MPALAASLPNAAPERTTIVVQADARTGKLVRSVAVEPREVAAIPVGAAAGAPSAPAPSIDEIIERVAAEHGVETPLVHSVIRAESNYNAHAISPRGAQGIMQLIPATAKRFGVSNAFDPEENIQGGVRYLRFLLDYFNGDYPRAIAAYNAGEAAVDRYNGIPPYAETQNYVYQVAKNLKTARQQQARQSAAQPASPAPSAAPVVPVETAAPVIASVGQDGKLYYRTP